ncbi:MAG: NAD(P)H-binding protein [Litoreibacter sp.]|nr:NAD(P)H-binding protein [Litoreibacter sp.]MCY4335891.1 NAD(P)H-binding protein [Litoreibacter sp.]
MGKNILLLGATGTIGRATAAALVDAGHQVTCVLRRVPEPAIEGCAVLIRDLAKMDLARGTYDTVVSCIASRTGAPKDAWLVDHDVQLSALTQAQEAGITQFILLSAICVQKPKLAFQQAKLAFEAKLMAANLTWTIVRPTAFFKSLSGQIERVRAGKPYLVFGDGTLTACKPISDADLGRFIATCVDDPSKTNKVLPIGGPGPAMTPLDQGHALFEVFGREPKFKHVPVAVISTIIKALSLAGLVSSKAREKSELARIGHYYATESMLVWDTETQTYNAEMTPEFGSDRLEEHFRKAKDGKIEDNRGAHAVF